MSAVTELLRLVERLEELHNKVQGVISSPHLATTLIFDVSGRWILYLNRYVAALVSDYLNAPGSHAPFLLKPILSELEGGRYMGPIIPESLAYLVNKTSGRGGGSGVGPTAEKRKSSPTGGT